MDAPNTIIDGLPPRRSANIGEMPPGRFCISYFGPASRIANLYDSDAERRGAHEEVYCSQGTAFVLNFDGVRTRPESGCRAGGTESKGSATSTADCKDRT